VNTSSLQDIYNRKQQAKVSGPEYPPNEDANFEVTCEIRAKATMCNDKTKTETAGVEAGVLRVVDRTSDFQIEEI